LLRPAPALSPVRLAKLPQEAHPPRCLRAELARPVALAPLVALVLQVDLAVRPLAAAGFEQTNSMLAR